MKWIIYLAVVAKIASGLHCWEEKADCGDPGSLRYYSKYDSSENRLEYKQHVTVGSQIEDTRPSQGSGEVGQSRNCSTLKADGFYRKSDRNDGGSLSGATEDEESDSVRIQIV
ncbi:hypothetical protein K457DRAFT_26419 [Linnemannia elongata AG-77]|uniref:Uncharacterized protein n=1 Tax=Linnemannia elongata AG-77 TaxID=1314771 RepID=A0A197JAF6_9FUNG|nr:hypothetical protein K457DRAFT_26419 [Linnemannia elongata AG-77]